MQRDFVESLLRSGIIEAKAGEKGIASRYLERAINISSDHTLLAEAWFWMSVISEDLVEKRSRLENCLSHDMQHARARRSLAVLDGKLKAEDIIDPNTLSAVHQEASQTLADRFMCPQCGARMLFAPDGQTLVCENCTNQQSLSSQDEAEEQDFLIAMATARGHRQPVAMQTFRCQGCDAEFILPPAEISASCAYCQSPHVVSLEQTRELIQPEGIIPHTMDWKHASRLVDSWVETNQMTLEEPLNTPRGVYLPIWTFDIGGEIEYSGYTSETENDFGKGSHNSHRKSDAYPVHIDDLPVPASRNMARRLASLLPTFELHGILPYDPRYLANWAAEVYSVPLAEASLDARSQAYTRLKSSLPREIASLHNLKTSSARLFIESFKLVLLPVWMAEIPLNDCLELVLINGQNGIFADSPVAARQTGILEWLQDILEER
jgi:Zn finger protein HypA/HybF involved in hydrogenase expression